MFSFACTGCVDRLELHADFAVDVMQNIDVALLKKCNARSDLTVSNDLIADTQSMPMRRF